MTIRNTMTKRHPQLEAAKRTTQRMSPVVQAGEMEKDTDSAFLASIANLPAAEREQQIQRHEWYKQLASRQAITELEWQVEQYQRTGDKRYKIK